MCCVMPLVCGTWNSQTHGQIHGDRVEQWSPGPGGGEGVCTMRCQHGIYRVSLWGDEQGQGMDSADGCGRA